MLAIGRQNGPQARDPRSAPAPARDALAIVFSVVDGCDTVSGELWKACATGSRVLRDAAEDQRRPAKSGATDIGDG